MRKKKRRRKRNREEKETGKENRKRPGKTLYWILGFPLLGSPWPYFQALGVNFDDSGSPRTPKKPNGTSNEKRAYSRAPQTKGDHFGAMLVVCSNCFAQKPKAGDLTRFCLRCSSERRPPTQRLQVAKLQ